MDQLDRRAAVMQAPARLLFRAALLIFVVTIVIGILNGLNVWEPSHNMLLTHVHAGTLGWITLAVAGSAMLMFGEGADPGNVSAANRLAVSLVVVTVLYVVAFATGTGFFRPIAGTLMLIAVIWALSWTAGRYRKTATTTSRLALLLAMISLTIGAVLGVLLGLFIANGSVPGLTQEQAGALAGAHPPAMLIGYLVLAGVAVSHWVLNGRDTRLGYVVAWGLFVSGVIANIAFIFEIEALIQVFSLLEVVAILLFIVLMWPQIRPDAWRDGGSSNFGRMAVVFLAVGIGLLVYTVQLVVSGQLDPETGAGPIGVLLAFDHAMFVGVMTNALFAIVGTEATESRGRLAIMWGVNIGLAVFLVGLVADVPVLIAIGAPLMGLALLAGIYVLLTGMRLQPASH